MIAVDPEPDFKKLTAVSLTWIIVMFLKLSQILRCRRDFRNSQNEDYRLQKRSWRYILTCVIEKSG
jgi:hypothetical protein